VSEEISPRREQSCVRPTYALALCVAVRRPTVCLIVSDVSPVSGMSGWSIALKSHPCEELEIYCVSKLVPANGPVLPRELLDFILSEFTWYEFTNVNLDNKMLIP